MPVQQALEKQRGNGQRLVAAAVLLACLYLAGSLVMTVVVSLLLALVCDPGVTWLSRKGLPRGVGASLMVLLMVGVFYLLFYLFYAQAATFVNDFPKYSTKLRGHVLRFRQRAEELQKQTQTVNRRRPACPSDAVRLRRYRLVHIPVSRSALGDRGAVHGELRPLPGLFPAHLDGTTYGATPSPCSAQEAEWRRKRRWTASPP